ncbi:MAG: DUF84 family protein [Chloroflexi bacterium]|nr:DUF84 family protein [Chloroflexota bacterium]
MRVAVGSTNPVKVRAVRRAVLRAWPEAEIVAMEVPSGVSEMPLSAEEGKRGALQRAAAARGAADADLGIGLEGAVEERPEGLYLTGWVAAMDRTGYAILVQTAAMPLPIPIAEEIRSGAELGPVMDRYSGQNNSKQHLGAVGFLTRGLVPRSLGFYVGVGLALAPWLRPELYRGEP